MIQEFAPQNPSSPQNMRRRRMMTLDSLRPAAAGQGQKKATNSASTPATPARQTQPRQRMTAARDQLAVAARPIPSPQPAQAAQTTRQPSSRQAASPDLIANLVAQAQAGNSPAEAQLRAMGRDAAGTLIISGMGQQKNTRVVYNDYQKGGFKDDMGNPANLEVRDDENLIMKDIGMSTYGRMRMQNEMAQRQTDFLSGSKRPTEPWQ